MEAAPVDCLRDVRLIHTTAHFPDRLSYGCSETTTLEVSHPEAPLNVLQRAGTASAYGVQQLWQSEGHASGVQALWPLPRSPSD